MQNNEQVEIKQPEWVRDDIKIERGEMPEIQETSVISDNEEEQD